MTDTLDLEAVIGTSQLDARKVRTADPDLEANATVDLLRELAKDPKDFFHKLAKAVLAISNADSAGVSLLDRRRKEFVWPAVEGGLASYIGAGTPGDFGPCGTVLERNAPILFLHPERHFKYLMPISPPLREVLLTPFHYNGGPVGTIWAVIHTEGEQFDSEDKRLLENLSDFAASAYQTLSKSGDLETFLNEVPLLKETRPLGQNNGRWEFLD